MQIKCNCINMLLIVVETDKLSFMLLNFGAVLAFTLSSVLGITLDTWTLLWEFDWFCLSQTPLQLIPQVFDRVPPFHNLDWTTDQSGGLGGLYSSRWLMCGFSRALHFLPVLFYEDICVCAAQHLRQQLMHVKIAEWRDIRVLLEM